MSTPTSNQIPKCRLCGKNHFARERCQFQSMREASHAMDMYKTITMMESRDKSRADPPTPAGEILANQTTAEKVRPGKPETAPRKRKAKKGRSKK